MDFVAFEFAHTKYMDPQSIPNMCEDTRGITALKDGVPQAVCIMDNWSFNSCMMHIWIGNPYVLRHGYAEEVFNFVFNSGRNKVIGITPSDNQKALKFNRHIGFEEVFRVKDGYKVGVDWVVTELTKERFAGGSIGQKVSTPRPRLRRGRKATRRRKQGYSVPERSTQ